MDADDDDSGGQQPGRQPQQGDDQSQQQQPSAPPLPDASEEDIIKYDMGIQDYASEIDQEDIDFSEI